MSAGEDHAARTAAGDPIPTVAGERDAALRAWVERITGGTVHAWAPLVAGNSRTTWAVDVERDGGVERLVVRVDDGGGPFSGTPLSLAREAAMYRAMQGRGVRIPRTYGYDPELNAVALERAPGTPSWDGDVLRALLAELARLHTIDVSDVELPGVGFSARADLELWAEVAAQRIHPPSPFVDFAVELLRERFPGEPDRLVVVHGDPGVGNLLWEDGRITALLDWELAHVGDPHDDLAFLTVRSALFEQELPGFGAAVREAYEAASGLTLDAARLRYWQAVGILRNLITCQASVSNPVRGRDRLVHHLLIPSLNRLLVDALAGIVDVELEPTPALDAPRALPGGDVLADVAQELGGLVDAVPDPERRQRARRMRWLLGQLAETWTLAPEIAALEAAETPASDPAERLRQLAAAADRRLALFPRAIPLSRARLATFAD